MYKLNIRKKLECFKEIACNGSSPKVEPFFFFLSIIINWEDYGGPLGIDERIILMPMSLP